MRSVQSKGNVVVEDRILPVPGDANSEYPHSKVYCANCVHCKVVPESVDEDGKYTLRVRCDAGKWRKKLGDEKLYKYFTVARRSMESCDTYEPMGDAREFIRELKKSLPIRDEVYG